MLLENKNLYLNKIEQKIDNIDQQIINLIAQRYKYIKIFQKQQEQNKVNSVKSFQSKLKQRKDWALQAGLNPNLVNKISQYLIDYYLTERND